MDIDNSNLDSKVQQLAKIEHSQPEMTGTGTLPLVLVKFVLGLYAQQGKVVDQDMFAAAKNGECKTVDNFREIMAEGDG